ncbi:MAG TPA: TIM barrel protein [Phycisphaerae bacterium]|nr:TIM barrel protein [Phycisphaerae bacterium]
MRLGGTLFRKFDDADGWVAAVQHYGYRAAYCPVDSDAEQSLVRAYVEAAKRADIVIAEVGAWSNPLSPDGQERAAALEKCKQQLDLADRVGACCCVNIAGSRGPKWDGPDPHDLTDETFDAIVESVREIIDAVRPTRTFYTLEPMPWMYPDSAESYERLIEAVDRNRFGVHFDPVNLINSPQRYFENAALIRDFVHRLGPHIKSCHAKDTLMADRLTVHLDEARPGAGNLDFRVLLMQLARLGPDLPLLLEHMQEEADFLAAAEYIRGEAQEVGVSL